jgi:hypothetical protein
MMQFSFACTWGFKITICSAHSKYIGWMIVVFVSVFPLCFVQSKAKAEKNQAMEHSMSENSCQLCAVEKLTFEPPPIYCTPCGARIKRNAMYYTMGAGDTRHFFCIPCYNEARGDTIVADGTTILKARLEKKRNDEETEEWVRLSVVLHLSFCYLALSNNHLQFTLSCLCSGFNVTNVKLGNTKYVHYLMVEGMMVGKLNILALIAT